MRTRDLVIALASLTAACGGPPTTEPPIEDVLAAVPCTPWSPADTDWSSLPTPMPASLGALSASPSGRYLYAVATWLDAGEVRRQMVRSPNLGASWCVLPTPDAIAQVAPSRVTETILYALTCGAYGERAQLLRTTDGGATWSVPGVFPAGFGGCVDLSTRLATSMTDPGELWFTDQSEGITSFVSDDGAETWTAIQPPPALNPIWDPQSQDEIRVLREIQVDPTDARRMLAWGEVLSVATNARVQRWFASDDAGSTWRNVPAPPLPADVSPCEVVVDAGATIYVTGGPSLIRSSDWGATWTVSGALPEPSVHLTTLDSREPGRLFAWQRQVVWTTADGGASWSSANVPLEPVVLDPVLGPAHDTIVGFGPTGIATTTNGGGAWTWRATVPLPAFVQSPVDLQLWGGSYRQVTRDGSQPVLKSADGGGSWTTGGVPGGILLVDGANAKVAFSNAAYGANSASRTKDGGRTWTPIWPPSGYRVAAATCRSPRSCLYVLATRVLSTSDTACILARSDDDGETWGAERTVPADLCFGDPHLAVSPDDPEHVLAACLPWLEQERSAVCETRDGGRTWTPHVVGGTPIRTVSSVAFLRNGVALAATSETATYFNSAPAVIVRSTDGGATWSEVANEGGTLVASAVRPETVFLISHPDPATSIYRYTIVFRSDDAGSSWQRIVPPAGGEPTDDHAFEVFNIADAPGGGFIAATDRGLVRFR